MHEPKKKYVRWHVGAYVHNRLVIETTQTHLKLQCVCGAVFQIRKNAAYSNRYRFLCAKCRKDNPTRRGPIPKQERLKNGDIITHYTIIKHVTHDHYLVRCSCGKIETKTLLVMKKELKCKHHPFRHRDDIWGTHKVLFSRQTGIDPNARYDLVCIICGRVSKGLHEYNARRKVCRCQKEKT